MGEERGNREEKLGKRSKVELEIWILLGRGEHTG
jgi:hypothetical protein